MPRPIWRSETRTSKTGPWSPAFVALQLAPASLLRNSPLAAVGAKRVPGFSRSNFNCTGLGGVVSRRSEFTVIQVAPASALCRIPMAGEAAYTESAVSGSIARASPVSGQAIR